MKVTRKKPKYAEKTLSQCHFVHYNFYVDWPGIETEPPQRGANK
jgi:hypothetical protein